MPEITINKKDIPLWNCADGGLTLKLDSDPHSQVTPGADPIVDLRFDVDAGTDIALGARNSVRIGVQTGTREPSIFTRRAVLPSSIVAAMPPEASASHRL
jgi:hypothetical protein